MTRAKLFVIMGKSMSGKSFLQRWIKDLGIEPMKTHTTRPKRYEWEDGYIFETHVPQKRIASREYDVATGERWYYWLTRDDLNIEKDSSLITDFKGYKDVVKSVNIVDVEIVPIYLDVSLYDRMKNYLNSERSTEKEAEIIRRLGADEEDFEEIKNYNYCYKFKNTNDAYMFIKHNI